MFPRTCVKSDSNEYKSLSSPLEWKNNSSPLIAVFNPIKFGFLLITKRFVGRKIDEDNPSVETVILDPLAVSNDWLISFKWMIMNIDTLRWNVIIYRNISKNK